MLKRSYRPCSQRGLTLIELMIAIVLGALVVSAVIGMYLAVNRSFVEDQRYAVMQENGRYAMRTLAGDLTMSDFWGRMSAIDTVTPIAGTGSCATAAGLNLFDPDTALLLVDGQGGVSHFTPCTEITDDQVANSDLIAIKHVSRAPVAETFIDFDDVDGDGNTTEQLTLGAADLASGVVYLSSNGVVGSIEDGLASGTVPPLGVAFWEYQPRIYFLRDYFQTDGDGIPSLCRLALVGDALGSPTDPPAGTADVAQCIAAGIEALNIEFGVDTDDDGVANIYSGAPTLAQMETVVSAQIFVLARSAEAVPNYVNSKIYTLGGVAVNGGAAFNDGFYRRVYKTTVKLRNTINLNLLNI
jgi:type IV pilus assembly protein PilW